MKFIESATACINNLFYRQPRENVRLVAIAKNEAAYLIDWIFHHLYFGFHEIEIYVNNTVDNTDEIGTKLEELENVKFLSGDSFFDGKSRSPQVSIYRHAFERAKKDKIKYIMFLDIDEFWTPKNLSTPILQYISTYDADVYCFEWLNRIENQCLFAPVLSDSIFVQRSQLIKSLISSELPAKIENAHNVQVSSANYKLADDTTFIPPRNYAKVSNDELKKKTKDAFILHRMYRSEIEYLALVGRPNPLDLNDSHAFSFKSNRRGLVEPKDCEVFSFDSNSVNQYNKNRKEFINRFGLKQTIEKGQLFILNESEKTLNKIKTAPINSREDIERVLKNVTLQEARDALKAFYELHRKNV